MALGRNGSGEAPEPPLRVESREELVYLLGEACELEHGLLCEYLYAQFSLKRSVQEGVSPEQLARNQHPDRGRGRPPFRAAQLPDPVPLVPGGRPDRAAAVWRAGAAALHVPR